MISLRQTKDSWLHALAFLSLLLFLVSFVLPAARFPATALSSTDEPIVREGYHLAVGGLIGLVLLHPVGLANPFFLVAWWAFGTRHWLAAGIWASLATISASTVCTPIGILADDHYDLLPGYYVWLSSMALLAAAAFTGLLLHETGVPSSSEEPGIPSTVCTA
jgi:hypothetical protein